MNPLLACRERVNNKLYFATMKRQYVDTTIFSSRNMVEDGNVDYQYWFNKSIKERLMAAATMISVAFQEPGFLEKKVDRTIFSSRKHSL